MLANCIASEYADEGDLGGGGGGGGDVEVVVVCFGNVVTLH